MSVYAHNVDAIARIYDSEGRLWVTHTELLEAGYENLEDFTIVYLNGEFYELQGYASTPDAWWLEVADGETPESLPEEA